MPPRPREPPSAGSALPEVSRRWREPGRGARSRAGQGYPRVPEEQAAHGASGRAGGTDVERHMTAARGDEGRPRRRAAPNFRYRVFVRLTGGVSRQEPKSSITHSRRLLRPRGSWIPKPSRGLVTPCGPAPSGQGPVESPLISLTQTCRRDRRHRYRSSAQRAHWQTCAGRCRRQCGA